MDAFQLKPIIVKKATKRSTTTTMNTKKKRRFNNHGKHSRIVPPSAVLISTSLFLFCLLSSSIDYQHLFLVNGYSVSPLVTTTTPFHERRPLQSTLPGERRHRQHCQRNNDRGATILCSNGGPGEGGVIEDITATTIQQQEKDSGARREEEGDGESVEERIRNNRFASPLLEFGYPPAVEEHKQQQQQSPRQQNQQNKKPLLLYIPGFDGTYLSAFFQYPELHTMFEIQVLVSAMDDRSTYEEIKQQILIFLQEETTLTASAISSEPEEVETLEKQQQQQSVAPETETTKKSKPGDGILGNLLKNNNINNNEKKKNGKSNNNTNNKTKQQQNTQEGRPVYIVGESFGGIMALDVALTLQQKPNNNKINLQGLTLINAATCYDRSRLAKEGPTVAETSIEPSEPLSFLLYVFRLLQLVPMFLDDISARQFLLIIQSKGLPSLIDNPMREAYMGRLAFALPFLLKFMPQETLQWRLTHWLQYGCQQIQEKLLQEESSSTSNLRTLIIAGEKDLTLPSLAEAERLAQLLPNSKVHVVKQVGHANTAGTCLDLAAEMRGWFFDSKELTLAAASTSSKGNQQQEEVVEGRTSMKPVAANGEGIYFGMEPRYDGNSIGLNPLLYWSKEYYQKVDGYNPH